jgi:hypothetical protein
MDDQTTTGTGRGVRFRKLRIAWSVCWGLAAVLLIVLWVRSYWWVDWIDAHNAHVRIMCGSVRGEVAFGAQPYSTPFRGPAPRWQYGSYEPDYKEEFPSPSLFGFALVSDSGGSGCFLPNWALILGMAASAAAPWIHWSKRFSLRTMLIATTLVAVALGLVVHAARK